MKIAIITGPFLSIPPAPCGAVERIWQNLAIEFQKAGHEVVILCKDHPGLDGVDHLPLTRVRGFQPTGSSRWNLPLDFIYTLNCYRSLPRYDIVVSNTFWFPVVYPLLGKKSGPLHVHVARAPKGQYALYRGADRFAAESGAIRDLIIQESPSSEAKSKVFNNPIDTRFFYAEGESHLLSHRIVYTGRIHPEKGIHVLINAFRRYQNSNQGSDAELVIIGPHEVQYGGGGKAYLKRLKQMSKGAPVQFLPAIYDREKLAEQLRLAGLYCYPSLAEKGEAFGVAPVEAMACGIPAVLSDLKVFRDYIRPGENGFVFSHRKRGRVKILAQVFRDFFSLPKEARRKLSHAAAATGARFSTEKVARRYLADFEELVAR